MWLLALVAGSIAVGVIARVVPPRGANGPDRIPADRPAWPLALALFVAMVFYLYCGTLYVSFGHRNAHHPAQTLPAKNVPEQLSQDDLAFMSTVPPLLGLLALLIAERYARRTVGQDLGLAPRRLPAGLGMGAIGIVVILPMLMLAEKVMDIVYQAIRYEHPTEHPLLHLLGERPSARVVVAIVLGACVIAPLFEELVFRGFVQTLIRRLLYRLSTRPPEPAIATGSLATAPEPRPTAPPPKAWQTWSAIVIASLLFASLHPVWSEPIIFLLAIGLGYAYERTGNLWVSITMHAAFNSIVVVTFLAGLFSRS